MVDLDDEKAWLLKSQQGDLEAFESLIRKHERMIHSLIFRMTGSLSDAEDLAQETFIRAFQQLAGFRQQCKFSSWLFRIAANACLNWKKSSERQKQLHQEWSRQVEIENSGTGVAAAKDLSEAVQEALLALNPKQRAAVVLTNYEGLNHAEAAEVLGCSETTVSWRVFAARAKLKRSLAKLKFR